MKIAYIDTAVDGHHISYMSALINENTENAIAVLPEKVEGINCRQYCYHPVDLNHKTFSAFMKWMREIFCIVEKEKPDIVHFLMGDVYYKYFGLGLGYFKKYKTILTLHWARTGLLQEMSAQRICRQVDKVIVHSEYIKNVLTEKGAKNVVHIEYPQFNTNEISKKDACEYWGIPMTAPVIACVGNTRYDKGLDILLEALQQVKQPFHLLIAGKAEAFDEAFIREKAKKYENRLYLCLHYLSDEELANALGAADTIALPYRKVFNGASGPLGEGVWLKKCIIGSDHGNLGYTIKNNHLGYTFDVENPENLTQVFERALKMDFEADDTYLEYRRSLMPELFVQKYMDMYGGINNDR